MDERAKEEDLVTDENPLLLSGHLRCRQLVLMAQGQKRNPHRRDEGTKLRTAVGENETPKDQRTLHLEENEERSCTPGLLRDEPGVGAPIRSHQ